MNETFLGGLIMHILLIIIAALLGGGAFELEGAIAGAVFGFLLAETIALRKRVSRLERQTAAAEDIGPEEVVFTPEDRTGADKPEGLVRSGEPASSPPPLGERPIPVAARKAESCQKPDEENVRSSSLDAFFSLLGDRGSQAAGMVRRFLTGGNLVLKAGLVILFFGVAFLVKYAAQHNLVPIEFRLAGAALGGLVLLGLGWRLRGRAAGYGLGLQGGGIGILYLVVYGAAKLYQLLPLPLSLALMIALVVFSGLLAVLQDARMLAVFGVVGGFLAPVLMSTGGGSHVMLFSYYGLLNVGILGIAWYKAWRELNLLGFFFTFGIGTLWGSQGYQPQHFATTEPFLILYFLFYLAIAVLFAHRQPLRLRGLIDGPLVFGLPLVVTGLQYAMVREMEYGMAISACALGVLYLSLATILWKRVAAGMRLLCEAFLALGVMFATMTIPLALDPRWTTAVWALEGGAMVWVGVRQQRLLARLSGILLQLGAAWTFVDGAFYPLGAMAFLNSWFFGCLFLAAAALFSSYCLQRGGGVLRSWERYLHLPLLIWGLGWWYVGGLRECDRHLHHLRPHNGFLLFGSASTVAMTIIATRSNWRQLAVAQSVHLAVMVLAMAAGLFSIPHNSHLLASWGLLAWAVAIYCQYRMLHQFDDVWPERLAGYWHAGTLWLLVLLGCLEGAWLTDVALDLAEVWSIMIWGVIPAGAVLLVIRLGDRPAWPLGRWHSYYRGPGIGLPALLLTLWSVFGLSQDGDPAPLPYLPILNPLELSLLFVILVLLVWSLASSRGRWRPLAFLPVKALFWVVAALVFLWANGAVARSVHFFGNIPYTPESLYHSVVFQAAVAALWSFGALSITVWAARTGNRAVWCCGAVLLGLVVVKLFLVDLAGTGTIARIVSFLVVGVLMLVIGYFSPMPPKKMEEAE